MASRGTTGKRQRPAAKSKPSGGRGSRGQREEASIFDDSTDFFLDTEEDGKKPEGEDDSEPEELQETADEKRLRLAKSYLAKVKQQAADLASDDEDEDGSGEEEEAGDRDGDGGLQDRISARLQKDFMEGAGHRTRKIAEGITVPEFADEALYGDARALRGHRQSVTGVCLTADDSTAFSVSKEGTILRWDVETGARTRLYLPDDTPTGGAATSSGPDWVVQQSRRQSGAYRSLLAVAVSSDGRYLATGGGSGAIHIWDVRLDQYVKSLKSHKDAVSALAFREGEPTLYSASFDRSVKIWSVGEMAYVDTLYGHQSEVLSVDARRADRCVSSGNDHTCRVWKIPEESQLVFRGHRSSIDTCCYVTSSEWMTGAADGSVALWSPMRKKPVFNLREAHGIEDKSKADDALLAVGSAAGWVQSVANAWGTDLAASGAGDGAIKLWKVDEGRHGKVLSEVGRLPTRGFVNSIALSRTGRLLVAGTGQEPRLGRWARDRRARNAVVMHRIDVPES